MCIVMLEYLIKQNAVMCKVGSKNVSLVWQLFLYFITCVILIGEGSRKTSNKHSSLSFDDNFTSFCNGSVYLNTSYTMILTGIRCVIKRIAGNQSTAMQSTREDKLNLRDPFFNWICLWLTTFVILFEVIWEVPIQIKPTSIVPIIKVQA